MDGKPRMRRRSGFGLAPKLKESLGFAPLPLGQSYPQCCPQRCPYPDDAAGALTEPLGAPLSIREVAGVFGCSPWTVRQRYLPAGLPHHRLTPNGKLIFYKNQVIRWLLARQQKGRNSL
jgi:hypothetical protein